MPAARAAHRLALLVFLKSVLALLSPYAHVPRVVSKKPKHADAIVTAPIESLAQHIMATSCFEAGQPVSALFVFGNGHREYYSVHCTQLSVVANRKMGLPRPSCVSVLRGTRPGGDVRALELIPLVALCFRPAFFDSRRLMETILNTEKSPASIRKVVAFNQS